MQRHIQPKNTQDGNDSICNATFTPSWVSGAPPNKGFRIWKVQNQFGNFPSSQTMDGWQRELALNRIRYTLDMDIEGTDGRERRGDAHRNSPDLQLD